MEINRNEPSIIYSLNNETEEIFEDLCNLKLTMPSTESTEKVERITKLFEMVNQNWNSLAEQTLESIEQNKCHANQHIKSMELNKNIIQKVKKYNIRIKSQETILKRNENLLGRSLRKFKGLWQENLLDMESSLKIQRDTLNRISKNHFTVIKDIEHEINSVLKSPQLSNLNLDQLNKKSYPTSRRSSLQSSKHCKISEEEIISNPSAFSFITEEITSSRSCNTKAKAFNKQSIKIPSDKAKFHFQDNLSPVSFAQVIQDNSNRSQKSTLKSPTFSIQSKHQLLNDSVSIDEIKEALIILKKAKLINKNGNQELLKLAEMIKDPTNSSNLELMLQLIDIESKKNYKNSSKKFSFKPQSKQSSNKHNLKISKIIDNEGTSREKFKFIEDKSFNRTILSNENLLSPKNYEDCLDNSYINSNLQSLHPMCIENSMQKDDTKEVKLEDLLNVASIMDDLGLISADNSIIQEFAPSPKNSNETKRSFSFDRSYDHIPVKLSSNNSRISNIK